MRNLFRNSILFVLLAMVLALSYGVPSNVPLFKFTVTPGPSNTPAPKATHTPTLTAVPPTDTPTLAPSDTATATPQDTATATETLSATDTATPQAIYTPWPGAPACAEHDNNTFHTLWNSDLGCHYDHEHGDNPFTPAVDAVFPGLLAFNCGFEIGVCQPSSPLENILKHGGFKWDVQLTLPEPCVPFDNATVGANAAVVEYHSFGDEGIELEARAHSAVVFVRQCNLANPNDTGLVYAGTLQDYGQRIVPYQGAVVGYPNQPDPSYLSQFGPYLSTDCVGNVIQCRSSLAFAVSHNVPVNSIWTSKPTGLSGAPQFNLGTKVFQLLFRLRDGYRLFDWNDQEWPFTFLWMCSTDGGLTYDAHMPGCRWNNSTTQVQEIQGEVPPAWDNLEGFDTNPVVGRVTADGYTDAAGNLTGPCLPGGGCYPIHLLNAFVGKWGAILVFDPDTKGENVTPIEPERDIYFCGQAVCDENDPGALASGWIGATN